LGAWGLLKTKNKMKKNKKIILISIAVLVVAIIAYFAFGKKEETKIEYTSAKVEKTTIFKVVTATGTLNAQQTIDVGTQVSGIVSKIYVDFNDYVKKGQVIAMIDTVNLVSSVIDAEANVLKAKTQLILQERENERYKELLSKNAVSQSNFDEINTSYLAAKISLKSAQTQLSRAKTNLKYATITAPIDGVVISRVIEEGQTVAANFSAPTLFTIANDLSKMQLKASVDEADIGMVKVGQNVTFTVDAYADLTFTGIVQQIRLQPVTSQNVVTYSVMIDVPNTDLKLLPGMSANLSIRVEEHKNVFAVPLASIFFNPTGDSLYNNSSSSDTSIIWVNCQPNSGVCQTFNSIKMMPIRVTKGIDNGSLMEINSENLKAGMTVYTGEKEVVVEKKAKLFGPPKRPKNSIMKH